MKSTGRTATNPATVCLLTDFGVSDHYVAVMKGQVLKHCPTARLIDISHQVPPQSVQVGSYLLQQSVAYFPENTVFLCVVDPGVGTDRKAVAARAGDYFFVAPDNGLLQPTLDSLGGLTRASILNIPTDSSSTFHGRDVFAPAAGLLAAGRGLATLGDPIKELLPLAKPFCEMEGDRLELEVVRIDHFGNVALSLSRKMGGELLQECSTLLLGEEALPLCSTFADLEPGQAMFLWNSSGFLELAIRNGDARDHFSLSEGQRLTISVPE